LFTLFLCPRGGTGRRREETHKPLQRIFFDLGNLGHVTTVDEMTTGLGLALLLLLAALALLVSAETDYYK
jgi:hypothetical protein